MKRSFFKFLFLSTAVFLFSLTVSAQIDASTPSGNPRREEPLPKGIQENLKKMELERQKKDYLEMIENGEEAVKLSEEVEFSFDKNNKLSAGDFNKLERIEKLLKKIRNELGGDDDKGEEKKPEQDSLSVKNAISSLKETAANLFGELKKTSRFSISVVAIQSSNSLLNIVRFLRFRQK